MFVSLANLTAYKGYIVLAEALHLMHEAVMEHRNVFDIIPSAKEMQSSVWLSLSHVPIHGAQGQGPPHPPPHKLRAGEKRPLKEHHRGFPCGSDG